jgi:uncharacterized coiled-coil protein SlyX
MRRPSKTQRALFQNAGIQLPATRAEASAMAPAILRDMTAKARGFRDAAHESASTLEIVIAEQRAQIAELRKLVKYQRIHIARLQAGEDVLDALDELMARDGHDADLGTDTPRR